MRPPSFEQRCAIVDAQHAQRARFEAAYRQHSQGNVRAGDPALLCPCPVCGYSPAVADVGHAICRRCERGEGLPEEAKGCVEPGDMGAAA